MPSAQWTRTARDLSESLTVASGYLSLDDIAQATALSQAYITDSMLRPPITSPNVPLGALCRPAARVGGQLNPTPLWSKGQLDDYMSRVALAAESCDDDKLPTVTPEVAKLRGLGTMTTIHKELNRAVTTLRRYARNYGTDFPPKVAMSDTSRSGPPRDYRDILAVARWVLAHEQKNIGSARTSSEQRRKTAELRSWIKQAETNSAAKSTESVAS